MSVTLKGLDCDSSDSVMQRLDNNSADSRYSTSGNSGDSARPGQ